MCDKMPPPPPMQPKHLTPAFAIGDYVYPKADPNQYPRIVTGIVIRPGDRLHYLASDYDNEREYNEFELSAKKLLLP